MVDARATCSPGTGDDMCGAQSDRNSNFQLCSPEQADLNSLSPSPRDCKRSANRLQDDAHLNLPILPPQGRHARPLRHAAHAVDRAGEGLQARWCIISACR